MFRIGALVFSIGLSALFWLAYYNQYFKWRYCFNEVGRCFDSEIGVVYLEQSGLVWLSLALSTSCLSFYQLWRFMR